MNEISFFFRDPVFNEIICKALVKILCYDSLLINYKVESVRSVNIGRDGMMLGSIIDSDVFSYVYDEAAKCAEAELIDMFPSFKPNDMNFKSDDKRIVS